MFERLTRTIRQKIEGLYTFAYTFLVSARRGAIGIAGAIALGIAAILVLTLLPAGMEAWDLYVPPVGSIMEILWPIIAIVVCIGVAMAFLPTIKKKD